MLQFFLTPSATALTGVGFGPSETLPPGLLANPGAGSQSLTGVGIGANENLPAGVLTAIPLQSLTGVGIGPNELLPAGVLTNLGLGGQSLTGVGFGPGENLPAGTLALGAGPLQALTGVGISPSEVLNAGMISLPALASGVITITKTLTVSSNGGTWQGLGIANRGENIAIFASLKASTGNLMLTALPTFTLLDAARTAIIGPVSVTFDTTVPAPTVIADYLLDTSGLTDKTYQVVFNLQVLDGNGETQRLEVTGILGVLP